jgi:hypothetical protein
MNVFCVFDIITSYDVIMLKKERRTISRCLNQRTPIYVYKYSCIYINTLYVFDIIISYDVIMPNRGKKNHKPLLTPTNKTTSKKDLPIYLG